jgi:hypothetical protein
MGRKVTGLDGKIAGLPIDEVVRLFCLLLEIVVQQLKVKQLVISSNFRNKGDNKMSMDNDILNIWSVKIAEAVAPFEIDLAPIMAQAFVRGGKDRKELFYKGKGDTLGGFGAGEVMAIFPWILQSITVAAPFLLTILTSGNTETFLSIIEKILNISEDIKHKEKIESLPDNPYAPLKHINDILLKELQSVNLSEEERQIVAYRVLCSLFKEPNSATKFVKKLEGNV